MLKLYFGEDSKGNLDPDSAFNYNYEEEWFDDEIVKKIVKDIDKSTVIARNCIDSPILGQIPPQLLSGGTKGLIMLLKYDDELSFYPDLAIFGQNCMKWIVYLSKIKDFNACINTYDLRFEGGDILCTNDNTLIKTKDDWREKLEYL